MNFSKGDRVVCINDENWPSWARATYKDFPVKGKVYTIRDVIPGVMPTAITKDTTGLNPLQFTGVIIPTILLEEIFNHVHPVYKNEPGYASVRFAPVEPLKEKSSKKGKTGFVRRNPKTIETPKRKERELIEA